MKILINWIKIISNELIITIILIKKFEKFKFAMESDFPMIWESILNGLENWNKRIRTRESDYVQTTTSENR